MFFACILLVNMFDIFDIICFLCNFFPTGLYLDAEAAMDFLLHRSDLDQQQIFVFGRSLGGAVAIYLASSPLYSQHICAVILENTFTSIPCMGQHIFRMKFISYIPHWCYKNWVSCCEVVVDFVVVVLGHFSIKYRYIIYG